MSKSDANYKPSKRSAGQKKHEENDTKAHHIELLKSVVKTGERVTLIKSDNGSSGH